MASESAGGVALALAALAALVISNSPLQGWYDGFVHLEGEVRIGHELLVLENPLRRRCGGWCGIGFTMSLFI